VVGSVLVTALLVLPGATGMLLTRRLGRVIAASVAVGLIGALAGLVVYFRWPHLPAGPSIVLALFLQFLLAYAVTRVRRPADAR
jgi:ABC-type Mn2+/Zn2+ transport system permease subunit